MSKQPETQTYTAPYAENSGAIDTSPKVLCVAVLGRKNNCVFLKSFKEESIVEFNFLVHLSLDSLEEKHHLKKINSMKKAESLYLGLLVTTNGYDIYGYVTNSNKKLIAITEMEKLEDSTIRTFFSRLNTAVVRSLMNPFQEIGAMLSSEKLEVEIGRIIDSISAAK